jgi:uncharacterized NAD(P)/FAD-binding protein YdhS
VLIHLLKENKNALCINKIVIYEKNGVPIGPGLAYSAEKCGNSIINMAADTMGLVESDPSHFWEWLATNRPHFRDTRYPPRHVYGEYLCSLFEEARRDAALNKVHLEVLGRQAIHLSRSSKGTFYLVDDLGQTLAVDRVVLALGNFPRITQPHLAGSPGYFTSPWPLSGLNQIPTVSTVCIIGTKLSAIDAAFHLLDNGHKGPVYLASRGRLLPGVQANESEQYRQWYSLELLARDLEELNEPISLKSLATRVGLLAEQLGVQDWKSFFEKDEPLPQLCRDLSSAEYSNATWRMVAESAVSILERYWNVLNFNDRSNFLKDWNSLWHSLIYAMPYENGRKLQLHLFKKSLRIIKLDKVSRNKNGFTVLPINEEPIHANVVVEAAGQELDVSRISSPLLHSLLSSKILAKCPLGGLTVDQYTLESKDTKGIYAIGSLTTGVHFYTNGIDRNVTHAIRIARHLVGKPSYPPPHAAIIVYDNSSYWGEFIKSAIPRMKECDVVPFIFFFTSHWLRKEHMPETATNELGELHRSKYSSNRTALDPLKPVFFYDLVDTFGISVRNCEDMNQNAFLVALNEAHIDICILLGTNSSPSANSTEPLYKKYSELTNPPLRLLQRSTAKEGNLDCEDTEHKMGHYSDKVSHLIHSLL